MSGTPTAEQMQGRLEEHFGVVAEDLANGAKFVAGALRAMTRPCEQRELNVHAECLKYSAAALRKLAEEIDRIAEIAMANEMDLDAAKRS